MAAVDDLDAVERWLDHDVGTVVEVIGQGVGRVVDVHVYPGDHVEANDPVLTLEAMKMELELAAPSSGTVSEVFVSCGDPVESDTALIRIKLRHQAQ